MPAGVGAGVSSVVSALYFAYTGVMTEINNDCEFHQSQIEISKSIDPESGDSKIDTALSEEFVENICGYNPGVFQAFGMLLYGYGVDAEKLNAQNSKGSDDGSS